MLWLLVAVAGVLSAREPHDEDPENAQWRGYAERKNLQHLLDGVRELNKERGEELATLESEDKDRGDYIPPKTDSFLQEHEKPTFDQVEAKLKKDHEALLAAFAKYEKQDGTDPDDKAKASSLAQLQTRRQRRVAAQAELQAKLSQMQRKQEKFTAVLRTLPKPSFLQTKAMPRSLEDRLEALHQKIHDEWGDDEAILKKKGYDGLVSPPGAIVAPSSLLEESTEFDGSTEESRRISDRFREVSSQLHELGDKVTERNQQFAAEFKGWHLAPSSLLQTQETNEMKAFSEQMGQIVAKGAKMVYPDTNKFQDMVQQLPQKTQKEFHNIVSLLQKQALHPSSFLETAEDAEADMVDTKIAAQDAQMKQQFKAINAGYAENVRGLRKLASRFTEDNREFKEKMGSLNDVPMSLMQTLESVKHMPSIEESVAAFDRKVAQDNHRLDREIADFKRKNPDWEKGAPQSLLEEDPIDPSIAAIWKKANAAEQKEFTDMQKGYGKLKDSMAHIMDPNPEEQKIYSRLFNDKYYKPTKRDLDRMAAPEPGPPAALLQTREMPVAKEEKQLEANFDDMERKFKSASDIMQSEREQDEAEAERKKLMDKDFADPTSLLQGKPEVEQIMNKLKKLQVNMERDDPPSPASLLQRTHPAPSLNALQEQVATLRRKYSPKNFAAWLARDTARDEARMRADGASLLETGADTATDTAQSVAAERAQGILHGLVPYAQGIASLEQQNERALGKAGLVHMGRADLENMRDAAKKLQDHIRVDQEAKAMIEKLLGKAPRTSLLETDGAKEDARLYAVDHMQEASERRQQDFSAMFSRMKSLDAALRQHIADHARAMGESVPTSFLEETGADYEAMHLKHLAMMQKTNSDFAKLSNTLDPRSLTSLIQTQKPKVPSNDELETEYDNEKSEFEDIGSESKTLASKVDAEIAAAKRAPADEPSAPRAPKRSMAKDLAKLSAMYDDLAGGAKPADDDASLLEVGAPDKEWYPIDVHATKMQLDKDFNAARDAAQRMRQLDGLGSVKASLAQRRDLPERQRSDEAQSVNGESPLENGPEVSSGVQGALADAEAAVASETADPDAAPEDEDVPEDSDSEPEPMVDDGHGGQRPLTFADLRKDLGEIDDDVKATEQRQDDIRKDFKTDEAQAQAWLKQHPRHKSPYGFGTNDDEVASLLQNPHAFEAVGSMLEARAQPPKKDAGEELSALDDRLEKLQSDAAASRSAYEQKREKLQQERAQRLAAEREKLQQGASSFIEDHHKSTNTGKGAQAATHPRRGPMSKLEQSEERIRDDRRKDKERDASLAERSRDLGEKMKDEAAEAKRQLREINALKQDLIENSASSLAQTRAREQPKDKEESDAEIEEEPQLRRYFDTSQWNDNDDAAYRRDHAGDDADDAEARQDAENAKFGAKFQREEDEAQAVVKAAKQRRKETDAMGSRLDEMFKEMDGVNEGLQADKDKLAKETEKVTKASFAQLQARRKDPEDDEPVDKDPDGIKPFGYYDQQEKAAQAAFDAKARQEIEDVKADEDDVEHAEAKEEEDKQDPFAKVKQDLEDDADDAHVEPEHPHEKEFHEGVDTAIANGAARTLPKPTSMLQTRQRTHDRLAVTDFSNGKEAAFQEDMRDMVGNWKRQWDKAAKAGASSFLQEGSANDFGERKIPTMAEARKEFDNIGALEQKLAFQEERMKADTARYTSSGKLGSLVETAPDPNSELGQIMDKIDRFKHHIKEDHEKYERTPQHVLVDSKADFKKVKDELTQEREKLKHQAEMYRDEWMATAHSEASSFAQTGEIPDGAKELKQAFTPGSPDLTPEEKKERSHRIALREYSVFPHPEATLAKVKYGKDAPVITGTDKYGPDPKFGQLMQELQTLKDDGHNEEAAIDANEADLDKYAPHLVADETKHRDQDYEEAIFGKPRTHAIDYNGGKQPSLGLSADLPGESLLETLPQATIKGLDVREPAWNEPDDLPDALKLGQNKEELEKFIAKTGVSKALARSRKLETDMDALFKESLDESQQEKKVMADYINQDKKKEPKIYEKIPKPGDDTYLDFYDDENDERDGGPTPEEKAAELKAEKAAALKAKAEALSVPRPPAAPSSFAQRAQHPDYAEWTESLWDDAQPNERSHKKHDAQYNAQLSSLEQKMDTAQAQTKMTDDAKAAENIYVPDVTQDWLGSGSAPPDMVVDSSAARDVVQGTGFDASDLLPHQDADTRAFIGGAGAFVDDDVTSPGSLLEAKAGAHMRTH